MDTLTRNFEPNSPYLCVTVAPGSPCFEAGQVYWTNNDGFLVTDFNGELVRSTSSTFVPREVPVSEALNDLAEADGPHLDDLPVCDTPYAGDRCFQCGAEPGEICRRVSNVNMACTKPGATQPLTQEDFKDALEGETVADMPTLIESDGGSSDYYRLPSHATELRHLMSAKAMSKARADIFKACYRLGQKSGASVQYDINKMRFFIEDLQEMFDRGEHL